MCGVESVCHSRALPTNTVLTLIAGQLTLSSSIMPILGSVQHLVVEIQFIPLLLSYLGGWGTQVWKNRAIWGSCIVILHNEGMNCIVSISEKFWSLVHVSCLAVGERSLIVQYLYLITHWLVLVLKISYEYSICICICHGCWHWFRQCTIWNYVFSVVTGWIHWLTGMRGGVEAE